MSDAQSLALPRAAARSKPKRKKRRPFGPKERWALFWCLWCVVWSAWDVYLTLHYIDKGEPGWSAWSLFWAMFLWWLFRKDFWPILKAWIKSGDSDD
jgi:hypothetical protein